MGMGPLARRLDCWCQATISRSPVEWSPWCGEFRHVFERSTRVLQVLQIPKRSPHCLNVHFSGGVAAGDDGSGSFTEPQWFGDHFFWGRSQQGESCTVGGRSWVVCELNNSTGKNVEILAGWLVFFHQDWHILDVQLFFEQMNGRKYTLAKMVAQFWDKWRCEKPAESKRLTLCSWLKFRQFSHSQNWMMGYFHGIFSGTVCRNFHG